VRIFTLLVSLEVSDSCDLDAIDGQSEEDVSFSVLLLLLERSRLRTLIANRYLHMSRGFVPKSAEWGMYFLMHCQSTGGVVSCAWAVVHIIY